MSHQHREPDYLHSLAKYEWFRIEFKLVARIIACLFVAGGLVVCLVNPDWTAGYFEGVFAIGGLAFVVACFMVLWAFIKFLFMPNKMAMIPREFTQLYTDPLGVQHDMAAPLPPRPPVPNAPAGNRNNRIEPRLGR